MSGGSIDAISPALTLGGLMAGAQARLAEAGIETAALDARLLATAAFGCSPSGLLGRPAQPVDPEAGRCFQALVARRLCREPMAYILGEREFWSLPLRVTRDTLVPRPDSETLVEAGLAWAANWLGAHRILDLGTGSGCLLLALLSELPGAWGVGIDLSEAALAVARSNAQRLGLAGRAAFIRGDWAAAVQGPFAIVTCNPPYIADSEWGEVQREVAFEPSSALRAGPDGAAAYRAVFPYLGRLLGDEGAGFVELGGVGADEALRQAARHGLDVVDVKPDMAGRPRCLVLRRSSSRPRKNFLGNEMRPV